MTAIDEQEIYDFTVIGGGPVGLFGAYYAGLRGMRVKIIDSLAQLGGQLSALYPEKYIYDVAGFPKVLAADLVRDLTDQAMEYEPAVVLSNKVTALSKNGAFAIGTDRGETHYSRTILIAAGVGAFAPRKLDVQNLADLEDRGIHYFVTSKAQLKGKRLLIVGGGDSAFDWSLNLADTAASIIQIHRSDKFRAHEETVRRVLSSRVCVKTFHELKTVHGDEHVRAATIFDNRTGEEETIEVDEILMNLGFIANLGPIREWGLALNRNAIAVNGRMETNVPGIYGAGDIVTYDGKLKLIATGFSEAAIAANHAKAAIDPTARVFPGHSTEMNK